MKKFFLILISIIIITGCVSSKKQQGKVELEFWTLQLSSYDDYIKTMISEYEATHPDVKIKWLDVPFKEGEKRALAAALTNNVPDVVNLNPTFSSTLASKKALIDFNDYLTDDEKGRYLPAALEACTLNGFIFGIPWYMTSSVTIYNKKDLEEAGLKDPPESYEDLFEQAKIIKEKLNKYAFLPSLTEGDYFLKILVKNNVPVLSGKDNATASFNNKKAIEILTRLTSLYNNKIIPDDSIVATHQQAVDQFQSGVNTFIVIGPNFLKTIKDNAPSLYKNIDVTSQITGDSGKVDFSVMNFVVPVKSRHRKEAVEFVLFITSAEKQLQFSKLTPTLPSNLEALNDEFFTGNDSETLETKARITSASQLKRGAQPMPVLRNQQELLSILNFYVQKALLNKLTPQEALNQAAQRWSNNLKE
jgi:putative chitobiose transport system substrate-binding protein